MFRIVRSMSESDKFIPRCTNSELNCSVIRVLKRYYGKSKVTCNSWSISNVNKCTCILGGDVSEQFGTSCASKVRNWDFNLKSKLYWKPPSLKVHMHSYLACWGVSAFFLGCFTGDVSASDVSFAANWATLSFWKSLRASSSNMFWIRLLFCVTSGSNEGYGFPRSSSTDLL